jgi:hypothetical protein
MMAHTEGPWAVEHGDVKSDRPTVATCGEFRIVKDGRGSRGYDIHGSDEDDARIIAVAPSLIGLARKLVERVEFDVNGVNGKGGNGGLTSDDTLRAAGELRVVLSRIQKGEKA